MLRTAIAAGLAAAVLAVSVPIEASAATVNVYFYGPYTMSKATHDGKFMTQECRIKYKWSGHGKFRHKVKVDTECHWVFPLLHPMPPKPPHPPMHPKYPK
jgi:hypothetical protein